MRPQLQHIPKRFSLVVVDPRNLADAHPDPRSRVGQRMYCEGCLLRVVRLESERAISLTITLIGPATIS